VISEKVVRFEGNKPGLDFTVRVQPAPGRAGLRTPAPAPREAPTQPMPVVVGVAADEAPTTVAAPSGYRPLWARNTSPPSS